MPTRAIKFTNLEKPLDFGGQFEQKLKNQQVNRMTSELIGWCDRRATNEKYISQAVHLNMVKV